MNKSKFNAFYNKIMADTGVITGYLSRLQTESPATQVESLRIMLHRTTKMSSSIQEYIRSALITVYASGAEYVDPENAHPITCEKRGNIVHFHSQDSAPCRELTVKKEISAGYDNSLWVRGIMQACANIPSFAKEDRYFICICPHLQNDGIVRDFDNSDFKYLLDAIVSRLLPKHDDQPARLDIMFSVQEGEGGFDIFVMPGAEKLDFIRRMENG